MIPKTENLLQDPIIIDEENGILPDTLDDNEHSSTGDNPNYQALVSLSGFDKAPDMAYNYGDQPTRPNQAADFASFPTPTYTAQYMTPHPQAQHALPDSTELPLLAGGEQYTAHDISYSQQPQHYQAFPTPAPRTATVVTQFEPAQGPAGRKLNVYLNAPPDLESSTQFPTVLFGSRRCSGVLTRLDGPGQQGTHAITVDIPTFAATGSQDTSVALSIDNNDLSGASVPVMFGNFKYTDATPYPMTSPSSATSRKRKLSVDAREQQPDKRTPHLRTDQFDALSSSPISSTAISPYSPQQQAANYAYGQVAASRPQQYTDMTGSTPHATPRYASPQINTPQLHIQPPSSDFVPNPGYIQERPGIATSLAGHSPATTTMSPAPTLVRTSTLQHDGGSPHSLAAPFSPYSMYPSTNKAVLKLDGDLNSMVENWTSEEISTSRRLIRFRRDQRDNQLIASFEPVTLEDHSRAPGNIYVNCIWWKEKQACYITSVDTIQLLESLVGVRFTVEEKNRIRRNLEGFRPATVSKTKQDCEDFFKLIMGFPSPKPRNIEKDVKVFPWRILPHALKKIIGKYSASYTSTAGTMQSTIGSSAGASINSINMHRHTATPPSAATTSSGGLHYPAHAMMTSMPSHMTMTASAAVPSTTIAPGMSWHQPSSSYASDLSAGRGSWDYTANFMDPGAAHMSGGPTLRDHRIPSISQWSNFDFTRSTQA